VKRVTCYQTADGVLHPTEDDARRAADRHYGNALSHHAHALARLDGKYSAILAWLDANVDSLVALKALRDDCAAVVDADNDD
jgi:hypothetical protein